ncbi:hypothetical protein J6590_006999 [Homalodisca vitripennis]|nr:hypothetical protein J6590_006999 [Homalodisca vitripennis]
MHGVESFYDSTKTSTEINTQAEIQQLAKTTLPDLPVQWLKTPECNDDDMTLHPTTSSATTPTPAIPKGSAAPPLYI